MNFRNRIPFLGKNRITEKKIIVTLFFSIFFFHLWSLMRYPAPFVDEVWLISRAWSYLNTGRNFGQLDQGILEIFDGHWTFFPWYQTWLYSIGLKIVGTPLLLPLRLISLLFGFLLLTSVFFIGKRFLSSREAVISVILLSLSGVFSYSAHLARADIIVAALGFGAIAIYHNRVLSQTWSGLLSGLLLGIAIEIHPNTIIYLPVLGIMFFSDYGLRIIKKRKFWSFIVGLTVSFLIYFILHIYPYPETYFSLMALFGANARRPPIFEPDIQNLIRELAKTGAALFKILLLQFPFIIWELGITLKAKNRRRKFVAIIAITLFFGFSFLIRNKADYYLILIAPIFYLILASFLNKFIVKVKDTTLLSRISFVFILVSVISPIILTGATHIRQRYADYQVTQRQLNEFILPSDVIMGPQTYWLGLTENTYYSWEQVAFYKSLKPTATMQERLAYFKPDIFIIDSRLDRFITNSPEKLPYSGVVSIPRTELFLFLSENAELVNEYTNPSYGAFQVYRIEWGEE